MPTATLTEDERLVLAAVGGWQVADTLAGVDQLAHTESSGSIDDLVLMLRPSWRGCGYRIDRTGVRIQAYLQPPIAKVSARRVEAFAATVPQEARDLIWCERERRGYAETTRLVWSLLGLARPAERRPAMASNWRMPLGASPVLPRAALDSPATATVASMTAEHTPETVAAADRASALRAEQAAGQPLAGGQLWGLPVLDGDMWADIAGATAITGRAAKTITSYLARSKPASDPFPTPSRYLGRNYWPVSLLTAWATRNPTRDGE